MGKKCLGASDRFRVLDTGISPADYLKLSKYTTKSIENIFPMREGWMGFGAGRFSPVVK